MDDKFELYIKDFMEETGIQEVFKPNEEMIKKSGKARKSTLFGLLCLSSIYLSRSDLEGLDDSWVDGEFDGGIDFIFFDNDSTTVYVGQTKYGKIKNAECISCIKKMVYSVKSIKEKRYKSFDGHKIKSEIIKLINRALIDKFDFEYVVFAKELINNEEELKSEIKDINNKEDYKVSVYYGENLIDLILEDRIERKPVKRWELNYDSRNLLRLISEELDGYIINISAWDLIQLYQKEKWNLFKYNIREFISKNTGFSGKVNDGLRRTAENNPDWFWFANNGIIIIAENVDFNVAIITLKNFSIINGAQTVTNLYNIYNSDLEQKEKFKKIFIVAKIIKNFKKQEELNELIITASNTQKPVTPWTFFSSNSQAIKMKINLEKFGLILNIKEGEPLDTTKNKNLPRNKKWQFTTFANYVQKSKSFFGFLPGKAIQAKNKLFEKEGHFFDLFINVKNDTGCLSYIYLSDAVLMNFQENSNELFKSIKRLRLWIINIFSILLLKEKSYKIFWTIVQSFKSKGYLELGEFYSNFEQEFNFKEIFWLSVSNINKLEELIELFIKQERFIIILEKLKTYSENYQTKDIYRDENYFAFLIKEKKEIELIRKNVFDFF